MLIRKLLIIIIIFANLWWFPIFKENLLYGLLVITITLSLFILTLKLLTHKLAFILLMITFITSSLLLSISLLKDHFDYTLQKMSPAEELQLMQRHGLYADGLKLMFTNKFSQNFYKNWSLPLEKYLRNTSYSIDPNLYFFKSHPREKTGIDEFDKYFLILLPLFIIGLFKHVVSFGRFKLLTIYLILSILISGFISPFFKLGPILFFPYINILIALGAFTIYEAIYDNKTI